MTTDLITKEQLITAVSAYKDSDNVNPTNEFDNCVYQANDGSHCLIGQVLVDLGVALEDEWLDENPGAESLDIWADSHTAILAESLQMNADGRGSQSPQPWKVAIERALTADARYNG